MNKLLLFIFSVWFSEAVSQCAHPDLEPLREFYKAANGNKWKDNTGWKEGWEKTNCDPCSGWKGVTCENSRVTSIVLYVNRLSGKIAPEIGGLTKLEWINLNGNNLTGEIPIWFFKLKNLNNVEFAGNRLEGDIPPDVKYLGNLIRLNLAFNNFSGPIIDEIWEIRNIAELFLSGNNFSGTISPKIGLAKSLRTLLLSNNQLSGSIPEEIGRCIQMYYLALSDNFFTGKVPKGICSMTILNELHLENNQLIGEMPDCWANSVQLKQVFFQNNKLTGSIPATFGDSRDLFVINVSVNKLTGSLPTSLTKLNNLFVFDASVNDLSGCIDPSFGKFCEEEFKARFYLSNNPKLPKFNGFSSFCDSDRSLEFQLGMPCDDGFDATANDKIQEDCSCQGEIIDPCLVIKIDTLQTILFDTISKEFFKNIYLNDTLYIKYHPSQTSTTEFITFKVFPNPIFNHFYIQFDNQSQQQPHSFELYSNIGQQVLSGSLDEESTKVDVSGLNLNGPYLLRIHDQNKVTKAVLKLIFIKN